MLFRKMPSMNVHDFALVQGLGRDFFHLIDHFERLRAVWWSLVGFKARVFVRVAGYFLFPQLRRTPGRRGQ